MPVNSQQLHSITTTFYISIHVYYLKKVLQSLFISTLTNSSLLKKCIHCVVLFQNLDVLFLVQYYAFSNSPLVVFNAVIQNLLGHCISFVMKYTNAIHEWTITNFIRLTHHENIYFVWNQCREFTVCTSKLFENSEMDQF